MRKLGPGDGPLPPWALLELLMGISETQELKSKDPILAVGSPSQRVGPSH